jgi:hypothetical protein
METLRYIGWVTPSAKEIEEHKMGWAKAEHSKVAAERKVQAFCDEQHEDGHSRGDQLVEILIFLEGIYIYLL